MPEVLTLSEAAAYLRLPEAEVVSLIRGQGTTRPAGRIGVAPILLAGIRDWLRMGTGAEIKQGSLDGIGGRLAR